MLRQQTSSVAFPKDWTCRQKPLDEAIAQVALPAARSSSMTSLRVNGIDTDPLAADSDEC